MKLATTTGDFESFGDSPVDQVRLFEGTGFRHIDLNMYGVIYKDSPFLDGRWGSIAAELADVAGELGFDFCQAHAPDGKLHGAGEEFDVFLAGTIRSLETCARLGIPGAVIHAGDIGGYPSRENRRLNIEMNRAFFERLIPAMEKTGVYIMIENGLDGHAPDKAENIRNTPATAGEILDLIDAIDHPQVFACWDTGHANIQGVDQYKSIVELGGLLKGTHIADNYGERDSHIAPFQGTTNFDAVMQALVDIDYRGYFTFESSNILRDGVNWLHKRRKFHYKGEEVKRLMAVPLELKREAIAFLYKIGCAILSEYGLLEEE